MNFEYIIHLGIISGMLLLGAFLRSRIRFLQRFLIPSSIIAGAMMLVFYNYIAPHFGLSADFLGDLVYHLLNISFIATMLRTGDKNTEKRKGVVAEGTVSIVAQYGLQCFLALLLVFILTRTVMPDLFPAIALSLPLGFELGPGQAYSMSLPWESLGFEGATSVGLCMAAIGFLVGSVGGVILINIGLKRGWVEKSVADEIRKGEGTGFLKKDERGEAAYSRTESESIDSLTYHIALIFFCYLLSWALLTLLGIILSPFGALAEELMNSLWGVNFIFSVFVASFVRMVMTRLGINYTIDNGTMNRINGLAVDLTVAASLGAISIVAITRYWLPILLLSILGILITCFILPWYCSRLFKDYQFFRMLLLFGTATGTLPTGLALLRVVDPEFKSPASTDYVYSTGVVFFLVIPIILCANLPAYSYAQNRPELMYAMMALTFIYTLSCLIAYRILAGKRAFKRGGLFLKDNI